MGCKIVKIITDNGEQSQLYQDLLNDMPADVALETYLELVGNKEFSVKKYGKNSQGEPKSKYSSTSVKFKLVEFNSRMEQNDTMDFVSDMFISALKIQPGVRSIDTIGGINLNAIANDPGVVSSTIKTVQTQLRDRARALGAKYPASVLSLTATNLNRYLVEKGPDGKAALGVLGRKLADRGVDLRVRNTNSSITDAIYDNEVALNDNANSQEIEITYERIYDMEVFSSPVVSSVLDGVKTYIKGKSKVHRDFRYSPGAQIKYEASVLGNNRAIDYERVIGKLYANLSGIQNIEDMRVKLNEAGLSSPELAPIIEDVNDEMNQSGYKPITAALFATFAKHNYNMFSMVEDVKGKVYMAPANRFSVKNLVQEDWAENVTGTMQQISDKAQAKQIRIIKEFKKNAMMTVELNSAIGKVTTGINTAASIFKKAGFDITGRDLLEVKRSLKGNQKFFKNNKERSFSSVLHGMIDVLVVKSYLGADIFNQTEMAKSESKYLNLLSEAVAMRKSDITVGAYLSGRGTMVHALNTSAEAHDIWSRITGDKDFFNMLLNDPLYTNSPILTAMTTAPHMEKFSVGTFDTLHDNKKPNSGVTYGQLSSFDATTMKLMAYLKGDGNKKYFRALSPTQADRGNSQAIVVPKLNVNDKGVAVSLFDAKGNLKDGDVKNWLTHHITAEINRIYSAKVYKGKKILNYHTGKNGKGEGNATKFNLLSGLNETVDLTMDQESALMQALEKAPAELRKMLDNDIAFLKDEGVIDKFNTGLGLTKQGGMAVGLRSKSLSTNEIESFVINNFIYTYEQTILYVGDMAYFDATAVPKQLADLNKRMGLPFTPGVKLAVGNEYGIKPTARIKALKEVELDSDANNMIKVLLGKDHYKGIEAGDGMGIVSIQRYKSLMRARGIHSDQVEALLDSMVKGKRNPNNDESLEVLKGFYSRLQKGPHGKVMMFNLKYSIVPAIPEMFEAKTPNGDYAHAGMAAMSLELNSKKAGTADEIVMQSSIKAGNFDLTTLDKLGESEGILIHNDSYRFPQPSPTKNITEDRLGSQMRKIITGNFHTDSTYELNGNKVRGDIALMHYENALTTLTDKAGKAVYDQYISGENINTDKLINQVLSDMGRNSYNNLEYFQQALERAEDGELSLPLNYPTVKTRLDNMINSAFRNKVNKLKLPGYSAVQISSVGTSYGKGQITASSDLKFVAFTKGGRRITYSTLLQEIATKVINGEDVSAYKVAPAEVRVSPKYFKNRLKEIAKSSIDNKKLKAEISDYAALIKKANPYFTKSMVEDMVKSYEAQTRKFYEEARFKKLSSLAMTNGKYDIKKIRAAELDEIVLYRIPTQAKSTMLPGKIKGFLPESAGSMIQVPPEIVNQSGSDFDIDKLYIEMAAFDVKDGLLNKHKYDINSGLPMSELDAKSYIVEFHKSVLTSPNHIIELLTPNSMDTLRDLVDEFGFGDETITSSWGSVMTQEILRNNNKAGKELIAISSLASVAHTLSQSIGTYFKTPFKLNGHEAQLGKVENMKENKSVISGEISEIQNAALDNAKDPVLGKLNIDSYTSGVVLMGVQLGHGLKYSISLVNSPAVRLLTKMYPKYSRKFSEKMATLMAINDVNKELGIRYKAQTVDLNTWTEAKALKALDASHSTFKQNQVDALAAFLQLKKIGDKFSRAHSTLNFDSVGPAPSTAGLITQYAKLVGTPGTLAFLRESGKNMYLNNIDSSELKQGKVFSSIREAREMFKEMSRKVRPTKDNTAFETKKAKGKRTYQSVTTMVNRGRSNSIPMTDEQKAKSELAKKAGNTVDEVGRLHFSRSNSTRPPGITQEAFVKLQKAYDKIGDIFKRRGETPISNANDLYGFDDINNMAFQMDLVTIDKNGALRIYDIKSMDKTEASEYKNEGSGDMALNSRFMKHGKQLNLYRTGVKNNLGIGAEQLFIIPFKTTYDDNGVITDISNVVDESGNILVEHQLDDSYALQASDIHKLSESKLLTDLGGKPIESVVGVDASLYAKHSLSGFELNGIHKTLEVNRKVSPTASTQYQLMFKEAADILGYMEERQQIKLAAHYDSYLLHSKNGTSILNSGISNIIANGDFMQMTEPNSAHSVAYLLRQFKQREKNTGVNKNEIVNALDITTVDNREYIKFNNTISKALTGARKAEMMGAFEDLMNATDPLSNKLAESLTKYAIIHYGFAKGINSFMEFVPPKAHEIYTRAGRGNQVSARDFYMGIEGRYDETKKFTPPADFVQKYIQNNALSLPIERVGRNFDLSTYGERSPKILLQYANEKGTSFNLLMDKTGSGNYTTLPLLGVPNLMLEYHNNAESFIQSSKSMQFDNVKAKKKTSGSVNKKVVTNLEITNSLEMNDTVTATVMNMPIVEDVKNIEDAHKAMRKVASDIFGDLTGTTKEEVDGILKRVPKSSQNTSIVSKISYEEAFQIKFQRILEESILARAESLKSAFNKIEKC